MLAINQKTRAVWEKQGHPERCFAVLPSNDELIMVRWGEKGYCPLTIQSRKIYGKEAKKIRDISNAIFGITSQEAEAMQLCSINGNFSSYDFVVKSLERSKS